MKRTLLIAGVSGTGKTSIAKVLSDRYKAPVYSKDMFKEILFDTVGFRSADEKDVLDRTGILLMLKAAEAAVLRGYSVILESNFMERDKKDIRMFEERTGSKVCTLKMNCDMDVLYGRLVKRDGEITRHPAHAIADRYPVPEGEEYVYSPLFTKEELISVMGELGVTDFSYGDTVTLDSSDFEKMDTERAITELDELLLGDTGSTD